jgi:hypothetical protein
MMRSPLLAACAAMALVGTAQAGTASGSYTNDFTNGLGGNAYGSTGHVSQFGTMQLIGDYASNPNGTWTTGALSMPGASLPIFRFTASFRFAFNNNGNGTGNSDGFSFLFGDLSDMSGERYKGGEASINAFTSDNEGMAIGFRGYSDQGFRAYWGGTEEASVSNDGWFNPVNYGYNGDGGTGQGSWYAANNAATMATAIIDWEAGGDLVLRIAMPGQSPSEVLRTSNLANVTIGQNFTFGLAARIGGATWDVQIDDFNVNYEYSTPVVPGPAGIAALAGLATMRRRRR